MVDVRSTINTTATILLLQIGHLQLLGRNKNYQAMRTRARLAQLRSGWCHITNNLMSRINPEIQDIYAPTTLEITSLWTNPSEAAPFLDLDTEENDDDI